MFQKQQNVDECVLSCSELVTASTSQELRCLSASGFESLHILTSKLVNNMVVNIITSALFEGNTVALSELAIAACNVKWLVI